LEPDLSRLRLHRRIFAIIPEFSTWLSLIVLATAFLIAASSPLPVFAQEDLGVEDVEIDYQFGDEIVFRARIELPDQEGKLMLFIRPKGGFQTSSATLDPNVFGRIVYTYDPGPALLPPFSTIEYWFQWESADGETLTSEVMSFVYEDNRFPWRTIEAAPFRLHWVVGDVQFAQQALDIAQESNVVIQEHLAMKTDIAAGGDQNDWIDIYVYNSAEDLRTALTQGGGAWLAGHADPHLGLVLVSIPSGPEQNLEMERQIPHEIAHVMLYRRAGQEYSELPVWLNEGFASLNELYPNPNYPYLLDSAFQDNQLISLESLCRSFPASASDLLLAYAESASFTTYLNGEYGRSGLNALIDEYADGKSCERGAEVALGKPLSVLERDWRQATFGENAWHALIPWLGLFAIIFFPMLISVFFTRRPSK
jgi:Peptidase MA superfamily